MTKPVCLFCLSANGPFLREEHMLPESACNENIVLPPGIVCDPCNQYFGKLDAHFAHHHHGVFHKLVHVSETKKGKPPTMPLEEGGARRNEDGTLTFSQAVIEGKEAEQLSIEFRASEIVLSAAIIPEPGDARLLSRFLAKAGLETLYFKDGRAAFEKQFDAIRAYARYGSPSSLFVPFAWARGPWPNAEVRKLSLEWKKHKEHNRILAHLAVPGAAYSVSLHRLDETWALETVSFNLGYRIVANPGSLDAEPIRLKFQWGDDKHEEPSEKSGRLQAVDSK